MTHSAAPVAAVAVPVGVLVVGVYLLASHWARPWPGHRSVCWAAGIAAIVLALIGPTVVGEHGLVAHVASHLLIGMLVPLLLVWSAPVTLALRALPTPAARGLVRILRSAPLRLLTHPVTAAVLDVGGLWLLYRTELYAVAAREPALHVLIHGHMLVAGYLFTASIAGPDPAPHRAPPAVRAAVLVAAVAAHDVLAKTLIAAPPVDVTAGEADLAGPLMYYGALPVHLALAVLLCREWFDTTRRPGPAQRSGHRSFIPSDGGGPGRSSRRRT